MTHDLKYVNDALYQQSRLADQDRAEMEAQIPTVQGLLVISDEILSGLKKQVEYQLQHMAMMCEAERGGLNLMGLLADGDLNRSWVLVEESIEEFRKAESAKSRVRDRLDELVRTLADKKLWECATSDNRLTRSFAWSRIKETK